MYAIRMLADVHEAKRPVGASVLKSRQNKEATAEVDNILAAGKFTIKAWNSNCAVIDKNLDEGEVDILGHVWNKPKDTIKGKPKTFVIPDIELTKRDVLG